MSDSEKELDASMVDGADEIPAERPTGKRCASEPCGFNIRQRSRASPMMGVRRFF